MVGIPYILAKSIKVDVLKELEENDIRKQLKLALSDKVVFIKSVIINTNQNKQKSKFYKKKNLKKRIEVLSNAINLKKDTEKQVQYFIELIEKYKNIKELDAKILN